MVRQAIASVLAQRCREFELIVVDDGSTDRTCEDLEQLARDNSAMRIERLPENRGPAAARNRGVAIARGEFVAFLDSDDLWMPAKLARQLEFMDRRPELALSQCEEIWMRDGVRVNPGRRHRKRTGDFFVESLRTCLVSPSAAIIRRRIFEAAGGFDETLRAAEDYDLWLRLLLDQECGLLDEALVTRRAGHDDQLSEATPAIDRYRVVAILKLLTIARLGADRRCAAAEVLAEKCRIIALGLRRRSMIHLAEVYERVAANALERWHTAYEESAFGALAELRAALTMWCPNSATGAAA
jgi:glycosyltransferase involved in cell wall biosynthesis